MVKIKDLIYEVEKLLPETVFINIKKELHISEDIDTEVDEASARFGYFAVLAEKSETKHQKLKFAYEAWKGKEEERVAREREYDGKKSFTEKQMNSHVKSQDRHRSYNLKLIEYDEQRRIMKVIARSFEMKKDLIQSKSANRRNELKSPRG